VFFKPRQIVGAFLVGQGLQISCESCILVVTKTGAMVDNITEQLIVFYYENDLPSKTIANLCNQDYLKSLNDHCKAGQCTKAQVKRWYKMNKVTPGQVNRIIKQRCNDSKSKQAV